MKKVLMTMVAAVTLAVSAQWQPGQGIANDHARGGNARDVVFVARDAHNGYGYRSYTVPIGFTFLPWSFPNFESHVKGVRLNLGWGSYAGTYGLDLGTFSDSNDFAGIAINWCGNVADNARGIQIGLVNAGKYARGLQIGFINHVERMEGVQIGILNFATSQWTLPILNICW